MANDSKTWRCGKYELSFDRPRIMGVLNVTPDSFSDGGEHFDPDAAIEYGLAMLDAGATLVQIYTGYVYNGARFVGDICRSLTEKENNESESKSDTSI